MRLFYEKTDITECVDVRACVHREASGGRCDCLEIEMEHASQWLSWKPKQDDELMVQMDNYSTGTLYLNTIIPEDGTFRVLATALPRAAKRKAWQSFQGMSLAEIFENCAAQCNMQWRLFGLNEDITYQYIERENEGCLAFLNRVVQMEGGVLKTTNGHLNGIGIEYAQDRQAWQNVEINAEQRGITYLKQPSAIVSEIIVKAPKINAHAIDLDATSNEIQTFSSLPVHDEEQAGRWAKGLLISNNRKAEQLTLSTDFNEGYSAMVRVDVTSQTDMNGEWIIDEVEHDLYNARTIAKMYRCIRSVR